MDSTSQPSRSRPPLETLSIKQLLRLHPRDKLLVHPLEWTGRHVEVLQCSFEDSLPPPPSQEHLDEVDGIPATKGFVYAMRKMAANEIWLRRDAAIRYIVGSDDCPLRPYGTSIGFHFDGRRVSNLPCQLFTSRHGNKAALKKGKAPIAFVSIDCERIKSLRYEQMLPYRGRRRSKQTNGIFDRHVKRVTPPNRKLSRKEEKEEERKQQKTSSSIANGLRGSRGLQHEEDHVDPHVILNTYDQRYRTRPSRGPGSTFWPQVVVTDREDEYVHLFAAHISSNYLKKFDFPSRQPAKSAQQPLLIHHIRVPLEPYDTFRPRLLPILLHPANYYK
ncbi:hypothetical protein V8C43DRAFT_329313 [Trichoderma afarasin]